MHSTLVLVYLTDYISLGMKGRTSRVWDSLLVMKYGCAGGRGYSKESISSYHETHKVFSPEMPFYSKFGNI